MNNSLFQFVVSGGTSGSNQPGFESTTNLASHSCVDCVWFRVPVPLELELISTVLYCYFPSLATQCYGLHSMKGAGGEEGKGYGSDCGSCDSCESHCWSDCSCGCHGEEEEEKTLRGEEGGIRFSGSHRRRPWLDLRRVSRDYDSRSLYARVPHPPLAAAPPRSDPDSDSSSAGIDADLRGPVLLAAFLIFRAKWHFR